MRLYVTLTLLVVGVGLGVLFFEPAEATQLNFAPSGLDPCRNVLNWTFTLDSTTTSFVVDFTNDQNPFFVDNGEDCLIITDVIVSLASDQVCDAICNHVDVALANVPGAFRGWTMVSDENPLAVIDFTTGLIFDEAANFIRSPSAVGSVQVTVTGFQPEP